MADETPRTRAAREEAERALVRVVHHYGSRPEFVLLGGLVPDLLCSASPQRHAGTTDVDVQVDLEIASGAINVKRLEQALRNAEFVPDGPSTWRWITAGQVPRTVVKFELLADLDSEPTEATINFDECEALGAVNLRGTGFASRDVVIREIRTRVGGVPQTTEINVTGLAGFLLAKCAAARSRRKPKDWYDIAFVLPAAWMQRQRPSGTASVRSFHRSEPASMTSWPTSRIPLPKDLAPTSGRCSSSIPIWTGLFSLPMRSSR